MTDDLLDEATRLADSKPQVRNDVRILRALVERVQQAEAERDQLGNAAFAAYCAAGGDTDTASNWQEFFRPITSPPWSEVVEREVRQAIRDEEEEAERLSGIAERLTKRCMDARAEGDAARGKLDKVRDWAHRIRTARQRGDIEYNAASDVLAILDGKTGD